MSVLTEGNKGSEVFLSKCCPWFSLRRRVAALGAQEVWFPSLEFIRDIRAIRGSFLSPHLYAGI
jgi:hypothetical protein